MSRLKSNFPRSPFSSNITSSQSLRRQIKARAASAVMSSRFASIFKSLQSRLAGEMWSSSSKNNAKSRLSSLSPAPAWKFCSLTNETSTSDLRARRKHNRKFVRDERGLPSATGHWIIQDRTKIFMRSTSFSPNIQPSASSPSCRTDRTKQQVSVA